MSIIRPGYASWCDVQAREALTKKVAIVTDSSSDLPPRLAEELQIIIAPLRLIIEGKEYRDKIDISAAGFYERLPQLNPLPTTTGAGIEDFRQAFEKGLAQAETVLCLTLAREFSVTFASARKARDLLPRADITVIDTGTIVAGEALVVIAAARAAQAGASKEQVIELVERLIPRVDTLLVVDTLTYLHRGGRLSAPQYLLGRMLNFKPILRLNRTIEPIGRERTRGRALAYMLAIAEQNVGQQQPIAVAITHALIPEETEQLRRRVEAAFNCQELIVLDDLGPVCGTHAGPGALGMGYCPWPSASMFS